MKSSNRVTIAGQLLLVVMLIAACTPVISSSAPGANQAAEAGAPGSVQLIGAGATFPEPVYAEWRFAYQNVDPLVVINYQGIGSGGGKKGIVDRTIDFAGSDSLLIDEDYAVNPTLQMFPTLAGAVVPVFNLGSEGSTSLLLDGPTLAGIYGAKITKWNDPTIKALNPDVNLPDKPITVMHRSDGSGTTEIFTKFLSDVSADWKNGPGAGPAVEWPVDKAGNGIGGKGNAGVGGGVQNTPYSVGYVELSYAVANKIPFADMVNKAGNTVKANADTLQSAMADYGDKFTDRLTIDLISNGGGEQSWPIAGYTYMLIYMDQNPDPNLGCAKTEKFLDWVHWFLTDPAAAQRAADLGYAVLPETARAKVFDKLAQVTCGGQAVNSALAPK